MNALKDLKDKNRISEHSSVDVTSFPPHSGSFFSGWFGVTIDGNKVWVYGSTPASLGAWEARDNVKNEIVEWLNGRREFVPQAKYA